MPELPMLLTAICCSAILNYMSETSRSASPQVNPTIYKKASFPRRTGAFLLDLIILYLLLILVMMILQTLAIKSPVPDWVISLLYGILFIWKTGATPGKNYLKLRWFQQMANPLVFGTLSYGDSFQERISSIKLNSAIGIVINDKFMHNRQLTRYVSIT